MGKEKKKSLQESDYSDIKYILVLFLLALIVIIFGLLIYTFSHASQKQIESRKHTKIEKTYQKPVSETSNTNTDASTQANAVTNINTDQTPTFTLPADFDPNAYNPRSEISKDMYGERLIRAYFSAIANEQYEEACSLTSKRICNARGDISSFENFLTQLDDGYQLENIYEATEQKEDEKIFCVQYNYRLKADLNPSTITEVFQYRVQMRPDGIDEISARVCEKVSKDGRERPCPIATPKKYCDI